MTDQSATSLLRDAMPLCATLGVRDDTYTSDAVVLSVDLAPALCTSNWILHGGVMMAVADSAGAACALLNLPDDASGTATIESKTNFLGAGEAARSQRRRRPCTAAEPRSWSKPR